MNLRKCPQHDHVSPFANKSKRIRRIIEKFEISFVENGDDLFWDARYKAVDLALQDQCAGRVVWIWDENETSSRSDRFQHRLYVLLIAWARHLDHSRAERSGDQFVNDKCLFRS